MPNFPLKWMLIALGAIALGCVALAYASELWWSITYGLALMLLLAAPLGIIYRSGPPACLLWVGAAIFGWGYVLLIGGILWARRPSASRPRRR